MFRGQCGDVSYGMAAAAMLVYGRGCGITQNRSRKKTLYPARKHNHVKKLFN